MPAGSLIGFFRTRPDQPVVGAPEELARRYRVRSWVTFLGVTLGYAHFYTTRLNLSMAKKPMLDEGIASAEELGRIGSTLLLAYALGKVVNGFLADRAHVGRLMGAGLLVSAAANLVFGLSHGVALLAGLWFLNGWGQSMGATPSVVNLTHWFSHKERGTRYSIWSSAHSIGELLTYLLTAGLLGAYGWRAIFFGPGVLCAVVGVVLFWVVHDRPATYGLPPVDGASSAEAGREDKASVGQRQRRMLRNPYVWVLSLAGGLFYMARYGVNNWLVLYLQEAKGYSAMEAAALMSVVTVAGLVGTVAFGPISDFFFGARRGPMVTLYGVMLVAALLAMTRLGPEQVWLERTVLAACGFSLGGLLVLLGGLGVVDICPRGAAGAAVGVAGFCCYLGASVQDQVSGWLINQGRTVVDGVAHYDFSRPFQYWVGAAALSTLLASVLWWAKPQE